MINYGHSHDNFSSDEIDTGGVWMDGSPIYRKTVTFGTISAGGMKSVSLGLGATFGQLIRLWGAATLSGDAYQYPLPYTYQTGNYTVSLEIGQATTDPVVTIRNGVQGNSSGSAIKEGFAVVEYTKKEA